MVTICLHPGSSEQNVPGAKYAGGSDRLVLRRENVDTDILPRKDLLPVSRGFPAETSQNDPSDLLPTRSIGQPIIIFLS